MIKNVVSFENLKRYQWGYFLLFAVLLNFIAVDMGTWNYTLYYTVVEVLHVFMGLFIFVMALHGAGMEHFHGTFRLLGVACLFIAVLYILQIYAFLGAQFHVIESVNTAMQFRTMVKWIEAFSILLTAVFIKREFQFLRLIAVYVLCAVMLVASALWWNIFPICYTLETGATAFYTVSGYAATIIMLFGAVVLAKRRGALEKDLFRCLFVSFILMAVSEGLLIYYAFDTSIMAIEAHLIKLLSYFLIFRAVEKGSMQYLHKRLKESQERYSSLFEFSVIGMAIISLDGEIQRVNSALCKITGYACEDLLKLGFGKITHPNDQELERLYQSKLRTGELSYYQMEKRYIHKQGHNVWVHISLSTVTDEQGKPLCFVGQAEDITRRKKMEEELKRSEERYRLLIESIPHPIMVFDRDWRYVLSNNLKEHKLKNIPKDKLIGMKIFDVWHNAEQLKLYQTSKRVMETRVAESDMEKLTFSDGSCEWHQYTIFPVPDGVMVLGQDITKRIEAENSLRMSRERYQTLLENMPNGIALADENGIINYINPCGLGIIRAADENLVLGKNFIEFVPAEHRETTLEISGTLVSDNQRVGPAEQCITALDGVRREIEFSAIPFMNRDKLGVLVVFQDITEKKLAEKLQMEVDNKTKQLNETVEMDRLRSEFFANLSHELRTPLNIILSSTQLLKNYLKDMEQTPHIDKVLKSEGYISQNCYRLLRLINNLIDSTKIDANFYELNLVNCNVVEIVENITLSVADYIDNKELDLCFDTDVEERIIALDPTAMERIMLNLLANAVKFTDPGGSVMVEMEDGPDFVNIFVKDTGVGIPKESLGRIFERFTQAGHCLTKKREGSGIGLSLVKSLVELHGGSVAIESVLGEGTTLIVRLPVKTIKDNDDEQDTCDITKLQTQNIHIEFSDVFY